MHEYSLLEIFAVGFLLALIFGYAAHRLGFSPIVGYLLAGFLVGPGTPFFVADAELAFQLSEAGVILLMFGVGLHFDTKDLLAVKGVALPGAIAQSSFATLLGAGAAWLLGMPFAQALMLGVGLSVASTVVLLRVLSDNGVLNTIPGHVAVGWLVVEDLLTVLVLLLLPTYAAIVGGENTGALAVAKAIGMALARLALLWILVMVIGSKVVPWLLNKVVRTRSEELFTLAVLVAAFATAVGAAVFFQASMALGAFLGGMVVGRTKVSYQAGADLLPLRDAFAVLFFISVGMLFRPAFILEQPLLILACLGVVLIAKPLIAVIVVSLLGYSSGTALTAAVSLAQIGEFSFILAQGAIALDLIPMDVYNVLVVCSIISIALNPSVFRLVPRMQHFLEHHPTLSHILNARAEHRASEHTRVHGSAEEKAALKNDRKNRPAAQPGTFDSARQPVQSAQSVQPVPADQMGTVKRTEPIGQPEQTSPADALRDVFPATSDTSSSPTAPDVVTAIVVGYGPAGRNVTRTLLDKKIIPVVVDMNVDTVNHLNGEQLCPAVYGNSTKKEVLLGARIEKASYLIITTPSTEQAVATATAAKALNPEIRVLARTRFLREERLFEQAGVTAMAYEEDAVAEKLAELLEKDIEECKNEANTCRIDFDSLEKQDMNEAKQLTFKYYNS
ncbi:cation:proton antiporter [Desulfovibrio sp. OttesenSCG-928-C06]|nr:cation:proton antiporter [Desulfovibrio sp. OttesenSCG-928-C06]